MQSVLKSAYKNKSKAVNIAVRSRRGSDWRRSTELGMERFYTAVLSTYVLSAFSLHHCCFLCLILDGWRHTIIYKSVKATVLL